MLTRQKHNFDEVYYIASASQERKGKIMKKLSLALAILMIALALAVPASAAKGKGSFGEVPLYKGGITVDGKIDEAYTKLGLKVDCTLDFDDGRYKSDTEAWIYVLHDGEYLYIAFDVNDPYDIDVKNYPEAHANSDNSWRQSGVELFIDWTNGGAKFAKYQTWIDGRSWTEGTAKGKETTYYKEVKTTYNVSAKNYVIEMKLPIMEGAKTGSEIGFNAMITSNDSLAAGNQDHVCCTLAGVSGDVGAYKNVTLSSTEVKMPEPPKEEPKEEQKPTENPTTGDPITVLAIIAAVSGAGVVISKKR
ncbi:MAG: hypothetical protein E7665_04845 [Ruminococcaceae bacterium]|nr:hypothetical protein [Oscillospiraceae bacterium]